MTHLRFLVGFAFLCISRQGYTQSNIEKIRDTISKINKISVDNPSGPQGESVIVPSHTVSFTGQYGDRVRLVSQTNQFSNTLERFIAFDPNADVLYPGALVQGNSLPDGILSPINTRRTRLTITVVGLNGANPAQSFSEKVKDPSVATVTDAVNRIISQKLEKEQQAKITYTKTTCYTAEEGFLRLGASYQWITAKLSSSFNDYSSTYKSSICVRYVQSYYTATCEAPSDPASYIDKREKFSDFIHYVGNDNPPAYVASVTYGRELWMLFQTNYDTSSVEATLQAAFTGGFSSGKTNLSDLQKKVLSESSIQILAIGGGGSPAAKVIAPGDFSGVQQYIDSGRNFSKQSPGQIISYEVRYLKNNDVARVSSSTDYVINTKVPDPVKMPISGIQVTWTTTGDDKDWNTQADLDVSDKLGRRVAHIDCCSADRNGDHWDKGNQQTRPLQMLVPGLTMDDLVHGSFNAWRVPKGNDDWDYSLTIYAICGDGSRQTLVTASNRNNFGGSW